MQKTICKICNVYKKGAFRREDPFIICQYLSNIHICYIHVFKHGKVEHFLYDSENMKKYAKIQIRTKRRGYLEVLNFFRKNQRYFGTNSEISKFALRLGNNPMVGATVAVAVAVDQALNK